MKSVFRRSRSFIDLLKREPAIERSQVLLSSGTLMTAFIYIGTRRIIFKRFDLDLRGDWGQHY